MYILILGCMLFGEGQGTSYDASISTIDEIKFFENEYDATTYGDYIIEHIHNMKRIRFIGVEIKNFSIKYKKVW